MKETHKKHPPADRLKASNYHRNEFGIYGTGCGKINEFVSYLQNQLSNFNCIFIDADHNRDNYQNFIQIEEKQIHISKSRSAHEQDKKLHTNAADLVFVNGNHYPAANQIIVLNSEKEASLKRRIDQLDSVFAIIIEENEEEIFPFLKEKIDDSTRIIKHKNKAELVEAIRVKVQIPELKALILAGGKSMRMGFDKTTISYNGKSQALYIQDLCEELGLDTYISKGHEYKGEDKNVIKDRLVEMGPMGGVISAFMKDRNSAWLVIASDMPFVNKQSIQKLISERNISEFATSYSLSKDAFPEPTFAIYEPKIYKRILEFLSLGYTCPRKVLINSDIEKIVVSDKDILRNINTEEEKDQALIDLNTK